MAGGLTPLLRTGLVARDQAAEETSGIILFDVMNVAGLLLATLVLLPALLSPTVSRTSTWMALLASSIFYSSSYLVLLPIGQRSIAQPDYGVCLVQASLVYGAPVLVSFAGWAYVTQLYLGMVADNSRRRLPLLRINAMLLLTPIVIATCMFVESLIVGIKYPDAVTIDSTRRYCHITTHLPRITAAVLIGIGTAGMIVFEVLVTVHLSRHWKMLREMTNGQIAAFAWYKFGRIIIFTVFPFGAFTLNIAGLFSSGTTNDKWNMLLPVLPLGTAIIFGSRMDVIRAWKFWSASYNRAWNIYEESKVQCSCPHQCGKTSKFGRPKSAQSEV